MMMRQSEVHSKSEIISQDADRIKIKWKDDMAMQDDVKALGMWQSDDMVKQDDVAKWGDSRDQVTKWDVDKIKMMW